MINKKLLSRFSTVWSSVYLLIIDSLTTSKHQKQEDAGKRDLTSIDSNRKQKEGDKSTDSRTPMENRWRELEVEEVAPMKADRWVTGEIPTFAGTPVRTTLSPTMRRPSLMLGKVVIVIFDLKLENPLNLPPNFGLETQWGKENGRRWRFNGNG